MCDKTLALENNQHVAALIAREKEEYAVLAEQMDAEARTYQTLAEEQGAVLDRVRREFEQRLQALQRQVDTSQKATQQVSQSTGNASKQLVLSEELTRILIDQQLIQAGWEADTQQLTYARGARPEKGKNQAIAEWPTLGQEVADYVLLAGQTTIAAVALA